MGSFLPSGADIRDVVHLTRCSRSTAGKLVLHYGTYYVQCERVASVYNRFHAWVDAQSWALRGGILGLTNSYEDVDALMQVAGPAPSPSTPLSDEA